MSIDRQQLDRLRERIAEAFSDQAPYPGEVTGTPPETFEFRQKLQGRSWVDADHRFCQKSSDAFTMLDVDPLVYFLPAFLTSMVSRPDGVLTEMFLYFVCSSKFLEVTEKLNSAQKWVLVEVIDCMQIIHRDYIVDPEIHEALETRKLSLFNP